MPGTVGGLVVTLGQGQHARQYNKTATLTWYARGVKEALILQHAQGHTLERVHWQVTSTQHCVELERTQDEGCSTSGLCVWVRA